jgi:hypothetical protein
MRFIVKVFSILFASTAGSSLDNSILSTREFSSIYVISDAHGDAEGLAHSLYLAYWRIASRESIVDIVTFGDDLVRYASTQTIPTTPLLQRKDVAIIQMGDLFDRGKYSLLCYEIIKVAEAYIGVKVIPLMGNHELMTMIEPEWYESLVHPEDDIRSDREEFRRPHGTLWEPMVERLLGMAQLNSGSNNDVFDPIHDPSSIFIHAGISEKFLYKFNLIAPKNGSEYIPPPLIQRDSEPELPSTRTSLNARIFNEMFMHDMYHGSPQYLDEKYEREYSPFTMRTYAETREPEIDCNEVDRVLRVFGVARIIVGHMPTTTGRIRFNCKGKIILTDIASSRFMFGGTDESEYRPNVLEMNFNPSTGGLINMVSTIFHDGQTLIEEEVYDAYGPKYMSINEWAEDAAEAVFVRSPWSRNLTIGDGLDLIAREVLEEVEENDENKENRIVLSSQENRSNVIVLRRVESGSQDEDVDDENIVPARRTGSMLRDISTPRAPLGEITMPIYHDKYVSIIPRNIDGIDGFMMVLSEESAGVGILIDRLGDEILFEDAHPGFPSIHERPLKDGKYIQKFLGTDVTVLLSDYEGIVTPGMIADMRLILSHLHKHSLCIGFDTNRPRGVNDMRKIFSFFGTNPVEETVEILNLSRLYACDGAKSLAEIAMFDKAFSGLQKRVNRKNEKIRRKNGQRDDPMVIPASEDM